MTPAIWGGLLSAGLVMEVPAALPEEIPEEVLRTEVIVEARSPLDGEPLSAAEYAQLMEQLEDGSGPPEVSPQLRETVFLLQLRQLIKTLIPFAPL
jgi:hypothetical protein